MQEIWKDIKDYEGLYQVSNLGRVKSLKKTIIRNNNYQQTFKEKILKPGLAKNGYLTVMLFKNKKGKTHTIHSLVAKTFLNNGDGYRCINHIDGNKTNNKATNLRWVTNSENIRNENTYNNFKEKVTQVRKSEIKPVYQLDNNYNVIHKFNSADEAANSVGCTASLIRNCCKIKHYKAKGFHWTYSLLKIKLYLYYGN